MKSWFASSCYRDSDGVEHISDRVGGLLTDFGLDHFSYLVLRAPPDSRFDVTRTLCTSYPDAWISRYMSKRYYMLDPVAVVTQRTSRPFYWGQGRFLHHFRKPQRVVFDEAREFRITYGLTIPIRGARGELAAFSVVSSDKKHLADVTRGAHENLFSAAFDTHDLMMRQHATPNGSPESEDLSPREKECLAWTLEGKTAGEIATILGLSVSTVNHHAVMASKKLGAVNKHHAAVQALRNGLIA